MVENVERIGNFTSSEIHKLIPLGNRPMTEDELEAYKKENPKGRKKNIDAGFSQAGLTYIQDKQIELRLGRSINIEKVARAMTWGHFLEGRVFSLLGIEYDILSKETDVHPTIAHWSGSPDLKIHGKLIGDIKCFEPKNFALYTDMLLLQDPQEFKDQFPKEYWQLISNALINQVKKVEAISYMPYKSELAEIRQLAEEVWTGDGTDYRFRFIAEAPNRELPYLPDGGYYKNLNRFRFTVPEEDAEYLTNRVKEAIVILER